MSVGYSLLIKAGSNGTAAALNHAHGNLTDLQYASIVSNDSGMCKELKGFIIAHLTSRATHRILLNAEQYEKEHHAIAQSVAKEVVKTVNSIFSK